MSFCIGQSHAEAKDLRLPAVQAGKCSRQSLRTLPEQHRRPEERRLREHNKGPCLRYSASPAGKRGAVSLLEPVLHSRLQGKIWLKRGMSSEESCPHLDHERACQA